MGLVAFIGWFIYATYMLVQVWISFQFSIVEYVISVYVWILTAFVLPLIVWIHSE